MPPRKRVPVSTAKLRLLSIDVVLETESNLHASRIKERVDAAVDNLVQSLLADGVDVKTAKWNAHYDYRRFTVREQYVDYVEVDDSDEG